ncbi:N-acetylornithine carbamoyltransferase [Elizabethkingia argentiflava]|uniref:N-succinylornithine carbamoyltransferase n=1 Tax=Elizabethkingia argenteiflava TaxID=2681556 RepID=A0A845Q035_9FLAO|nr:N-acetylornithine carbamoyltransferase [Elizabethkingia argenteiflava]NAW51978.1 N-acetylornithine carbamoyltransferase [Elizabethkingia argenteiflava]
MADLQKFTCVKDIYNLSQALQECIEIKKNPLATPDVGKGKTVGLIFLNPSLRTRISMQKACQNLGFNSIVINAGQDAWTWELEEGMVMNGVGVEHIKDAAKVLSEYCDVIAIRCFPYLKNREEDAQDRILNQFIKYASVPIISLESTTRHPLQSFADMLTIKENWLESRRPKVVLTWAPHIKPIAHSVANSFCEWIKEIDAEVVVACPEGYDLDPQYTQGLMITHKQAEALKGADFIYVKNWSSFHLYGATPEVDEDWQLTADKLRESPTAKIMHCLPVRRNVEIDDEVLDSENALIYKQAANRLVTAQWVLKNIV